MKMAKIAAVALLSAAALGATASASSAAIVCNAENVCWHTRTVYIIIVRLTVSWCMKTAGVGAGPTSTTPSASTLVAAIGATAAGAGSRRACFASVERAAATPPFFVRVNRLAGEGKRAPDRGYRQATAPFARRASPHKSMQAAWSEHGEGEFRFEELDRVSESLSDIGRTDDLKRRCARWRARLQADAL